MCGLVLEERSTVALAEAIQLLMEREAFRSEIGFHAAISVKRFEKQIITKQVLAFMKL